MLLETSRDSNDEEHQHHLLQLQLVQHQLAQLQLRHQLVFTILQNQLQPTVPLLEFPRRSDSNRLGPGPKHTGLATWQRSATPSKDAIATIEIGADTNYGFDGEQIYV